MLICGTFRGASERVSFGVRQLAAAFPRELARGAREGSVTRCGASSQWLGIGARSWPASWPATKRQQAAALQSCAIGKCRINLSPRHPRNGRAGPSG